MSRNGSGTYSLPSGNPVVTGTTISSTAFNATMTDLATALTQSLSVDGQTNPTANLPMATFKHTGVGDATARTQYTSAGQVQDGSIHYLTSVSGTNTITATAGLGLAAYAAGQFFFFISAGANTGATTLNINSLGAKAVTKNGTTALASGDIPSGAFVGVGYDGTRCQLLGFIANGTYAPLASPTFTGTVTLPSGTSLTTPTLSSPTMTGVPVAPTASAGTNTTQVATTAFVTAAITAGSQWHTISTSSQLTSGTEYTVTGLTACTQIQVIFEGVSLSGSDNFYLQLGFGSTTYVTSGYRGVTSSVGTDSTFPTSAMGISRSTAAARKYSGIITLSKGRNNVWSLISSVSPDASSSPANYAAGDVDVTATLTALKVLTSGSNTFDDGYVTVKTYY